MGRRKGGEEVVIVLDGSMNSGAYGSLAKTINEELQAIGVAVDDDMQEVYPQPGLPYRRRRVRGAAGEQRLLQP